MPATVRQLLLQPSPFAAATARAAFPLAVPVPPAARSKEDNPRDCPRHSCTGLSPTSRTLTNTPLLVHVLVTVLLCRPDCHVKRADQATRTDGPGADFSLQLHKREVYLCARCANETPPDLRPLQITTPRAPCTPCVWSQNPSIIPYSNPSDHARVARCVRAGLVGLLRPGKQRAPGELRCLLWQRNEATLCMCTRAQNAIQILATSRSQVSGVRMRWASCVRLNARASLGRSSTHWPHCARLWRRPSRSRMLRARCAAHNTQSRIR